MGGKKLSTGLEALDSLLGGILPGDNIIWEIDSGIDLGPFIDRFYAASRDSIPSFVSFNRSPQTISSRLEPGAVRDSVILVDCFTAGKGRDDSVFNSFYDTLAGDAARRFIKIEQPAESSNVITALNSLEKEMAGHGRYVFDSLTGMMELWQNEDAPLGFFTYTCPRLFDLQAIAYWICEKQAHTDAFLARMKHVTQIVLELTTRDGRMFLTLHKAENRKHGPLGVPIPFSFAPGEFHMGRIPVPVPVGRGRTVANLGANLVQLRKQHGMNQNELARRVGLSASAVCQMEKGKMVPSLDVALKLADCFQIALDSLLEP